MKELPKSVARIFERIDALQYRERVIIFITIIVGLFFIWDEAVLQDQITEKERLHQGIDVTGTQINTETNLLQQLNAQLKLDSNVRESLRLKRYTSEIMRIDEELKEKTVGFVSPQQMIGLLENLIRQEPGLQLVSLESTGPNNPLAAGFENGDDEADENVDLSVYLHGLDMEFRGDFFSVLNYVRRIESLPWRFSWDSVAITMDDYPVATVKIKLVTLSFTEGWIGV